MLRTGAMTFPLEVVAAALVLDYWPGAAEVHVAVWLTVFLIVIASFNFLGARAFGEVSSSFPRYLPMYLRN